MLRYRILIANKDYDAIKFATIVVRAFLGRIAMQKKISVAATSVVLLISLVNSASGASIGGGNPHPVSDYVCKDGTHLAVRLLGESASVSINGKPAIDLPSQGTDGTTYSDGQQTLAIVDGRLSWTIGLAAPIACTGG